MLATTILCLDYQSRPWNWGTNDKPSTKRLRLSLSSASADVLSRSMEDEKPAATAGNEKIPATATPTPTPRPASLGAVAPASPASTVPNEDQASVNPAPWHQSRCCHAPNARSRESDGGVRVGSSTSFSFLSHKSWLETGPV